MKYKCIKPYCEYDVQIMDINDIVVLDDTKLYNITKRIDYSQYNKDKVRDCLVIISDEITSNTLVDADNISQFTKIVAEMTNTYKAKNHDYGNSFEQSLDKFGLVASAVRIGDKMNRFESLLKKDAKVSNESLRDTLLDAANYLIMTVMWLDGRV